MARRFSLDGGGVGGHIADRSNGSRSAGMPLPQQTLPEGERELLIVREFDAPRDLVWQAWSDPKRAIAWWGPRAHPASDMTMDVRVGGTWRICLTGVEDGRALWQHGEFREVDAPSRLVFTFVWEEEGERDVETLVSIDFEARGNKTLMTFRQAPFLSAGERDGHAGGWSSTFDRLTDFLQH